MTQDKTLHINDIEGALLLNIETFERMSECARQIMLSDDVKYCRETADEIMQISRACADTMQMVHYYNYTLKRIQMQNALDNFQLDNDGKDT